MLFWPAQRVTRGSTLHYYAFGTLFVTFLNPPRLLGVHPLDRRGIPHWLCQWLGICVVRNKRFKLNRVLALSRETDSPFDKKHFLRGYSDFIFLVLLNL